LETNTLIKNKQEEVENMTKEKKELMDKMWKLRKNIFFQLYRAIILGLHFWKLVRKVH
jgi:hypothetical protein